MLFRVLLLAIVTLPAYAADHVGEYNPEPAWILPLVRDPARKVNNRDVTDGYYYLLYDRQINLATNTQYAQIVRQVVNVTGVQNASEVSVLFAPQYQRLSFHHLRILRNGRVISQLEAGRIKVTDDESEAEAFQYDGQKRAYVTLRDVQPGDQIDYAYSLDGFNPVFGHRFSENFFFDGFTPFVNYFLVCRRSGRTEPARKDIQWRAVTGHHPPCHGDALPVAQPRDRPGKQQRRKPVLV